MAFPSRTARAGWEERFGQPPAEARILKIIHNWPDQPDAQDQLISRLRTQGFGGVVCNVSFEQYLGSNAKWSAFARAVDEAKKAGLALWLYDERGYPSGNAGGITLRDHPQWEARGLLVADTEAQGGAVTLELPPGELVLAGAFAVRDGNIDVAQKVDLATAVHDGKLNWQAPAGRWRVMALTENRLYEGTHAEGNLHARIPYVNLLMPEPTARFVDVTYGGYAQHLGDDLGKYFMATFTDEPSLMSLFLKPMPYRPLPWAPKLPTEFQKRRGYALDTALLPALVAESGPAGAKIRYDFWQTVGELVSENYFGQIQTRCRQYRVPSGGHLLAEESIVGHVPLYGDFFRCIRRLDAPSIDCLTSVPPEVPWFIARLLSSAAELEGRPLVMSETSDHSQHYRPAGDRRPRRVVTEAEIRGTCNREIVAGINCITSYYSFTDLSDEQLRRLNEGVGRCCTALRGGHQVADIAVLYPTESLWTRFVPSRHWTREAAAAARVESLYRTAAESLFASQRDFTFTDSRAIREAIVESSLLVHGQLRWRVIVLPGVDTLPLAAWENLAKFVRQGGAVIALGALPANSESEFPSARVQALAKEVFGESGAGSASVQEPQSHVNTTSGAGVFLPVGLESLLPQVLDGLLEPDVKVAEAKSPLRVTHRRLDDREVYFVINDGARPWTGQLDFAATGAGERWNPATGQREEGLTASVVRLSLEPYGAVFLRFAAAKPPQRRAITSGALSNLVLRSVPAVEPIMGQGEFVRAELTPDAAHSRVGSPAWQAAAVLTKAKVDTHLFLQFHYAPPLDLSDADCLVIDNWVPDGQSTPSQLLVILPEDGGGDFLAETGRSLAAPGRERTFVALSRFQLAGWSKDADGVLDSKRVGDIRMQARFFLPAYEHHNREISDWTQRMGLTLVNLSPGTRSAADYTAEKDPNFVSSQVILDSILRRESADGAGLNGFVLLLHLGSGPGRADKMHLRLPELLSRLQERGYAFERIDRLLGRHLRASQVGYPMQGPKLAVALASEPLGERFDVIELDSGRSVFQGTTRPARGMNWGRFNHVAELDFSALCRPGRFRLRLGGAVSLLFVVGDAVFQPLPDLLLEFMRQQRCGFNPWLNARCHQLDGRTAYGPLPAGTTIDARGGWHDAADLLKYLLTSSDATAQMLLAWEMHRHAPGQPSSALFADQFDALGQAGANGLPDLLDEARWGLEWMLKLHPAPDQLYHQVADDRDHCGWRLPPDERADYGWGKGGPRVVYGADGRPQGLGRYPSESTGVANLAGRYAAAMALAFQIWKDDSQQAAFARRCLAAGEAVYQLGRDREGVQQGNSYGAPYRYAETTWADDMEWGAAELFRATGDRRYLEDAQRYARLAGSESWMGREQTGHYQFYPFFNAGHFRLHGVVDTGFQKLLEDWYREGIERCRSAGERNPFGLGVPFIWCSNNLVVALVTQCLLYEQMSGDGRYREFAARHRDWLLGRNPWGTTQFMGVGFVLPRDVHLMTTRLTGRALRGGLVDGPVYERIFQSLKGVSITEPDPLAEFQDPRAVYHDDFQDYASNEPTMDGTASALLMWAVLQSLPPHPDGVRSR